ncbi:hypothetical protein OAK70_02715 [Akkermansiaceae bacterium]|jgi:hypothetical protein|nr:hypothetical protein [Akkermansiaceae bacterium]MDA7532569.1 hypothetical protein [Akkermansiaceae bacterium]MDC0271088.1 hypothetical protein [Akkermansiaceae bacterium]
MTIKEARYRPLGDSERRNIVAYMSALLPVATPSANHPMRKIARSQIAWAMWRWTADGVSISSNEVQQDAYKYDVATLACTRKARERSQTTKKGLRHEHIVPRMILADEIISQGMAQDLIFELLSRFCEAVIVTKEEDALLTRSSMPEGWNFKTGYKYARYRVANLFDQIEFK